MVCRNGYLIAVEVRSHSTRKHEAFALDSYMEEVYTIYSPARGVRIRKRHLSASLWPRKGGTLGQGSNIDLWEENKAFFQASTVRGARYIDDAGKIINDYRDDYYDINVGVEGLRLAKPKKDDMPDEIAIDMDRIWIACYGEGCIKKVKGNAEEITKLVSRHIGVDSYHRLGFRVHYFKSTANAKRCVQQIYSRSAAAELQTIISAKKVLGMISRTRFLDGSFSIWLGVQPIAIVRPPEKKSDYVSDGLIIDVDVSEDTDSSTRSLSPKHLATFLRESSDRIVQRANEIIAFLKGVEEDAA